MELTDGKLTAARTMNDVLHPVIQAGILAVQSDASRTVIQKAMASAFKRRTKPIMPQGQKTKDEVCGCYAWNVHSPFKSLKPGKSPIASRSANFIDSLLKREALILLLVRDNRHPQNVHLPPKTHLPYCFNRRWNTNAFRRTIRKSPLMYE
jgi:hypothetical protein